MEEEGGGILDDEADHNRDEGGIGCGWVRGQGSLHFCLFY